MKKDSNLSINELANEKIHKHQNLEKFHSLNKIVNLRDKYNEVFKSQKNIKLLQKERIFDVFILFFYRIIINNNIFYKIQKGNCL